MLFPISIYSKAAALLTAALSAAALSAYAQNMPTGATSPAGSVSAITPPPEVSITGNSTVIVRIPVVAIQDAAAVYTNDPDSVRRSISYKDGFNRTYLSVAQDYVRTATGQSRELISFADNRVQRDRYSFLPYTKENLYPPGMFTEQKDYYNSRYINEGYTSYSVTKYYSDAGSRMTVSYAPGKSNVGQQRGIVTQNVTNAAGEVRIWTLDAGGLPVSAAAYTANQLFGVKTTGAQDAAQVSLVYTDKDGRTVMKQAADSVHSTAIYYAVTYYVYDELGRLRYTLPPRAVEAIAANGWAVATDVLNGLCFQYRYDDKGRQSQLRQPGEQDFTDIVYDKLDRVAMRRSALEKAQSVWEVSYYDQLGRAIATSLYTDSHDRDYWQDKVDNQTPANDADITWYFAGNSGEGIAPTASAISGNTMMSYHYYDDYSVADPSNSAYTAAVAAAGLGSDEVSGNGAEAPIRSLRTLGLPVYSKVRLLPAPGADAARIGDWEESYLFYDDKGRAIYTCTKDLYQEAPIHLQYTASQYDFLNRNLITKHALTNERSAVDPAHLYTELIKSTYNATGRMVKQQHKVDDGPWKGQANYFYDDMGRLATKVLGDGAERQDYTYNIRGQLQAINPAYTENGYQDDASRSFGEELSYDYGFSQPRYDGGISGMLWRGTGQAEHAYGYEYDEAGRLKTALYQQRPNYLNGFTLITGPWDNNVNDYSVSGIYYDKNGNLLSMKQRGPGDDGNGNIVPVDMDDLAYTYEANSNRLMKVQDAVADSIGYSFRDGANSGDDYSYDPSGNLITDQNKGLGAMYTWFNKPQAVAYADGRRILYSYDAAGNKVQEQVNQGSITKVTGYIGNFVYQNDSLQYMLTPEGRTVFDVANATNTEQFFVKDHLGNVRSVVETSPTPLVQYLATYELSAANVESLLFDKVGEIREGKPGGGGDDTEAGLLDGSVDSLITGTSLMLEVMAGDEIELQTDNYYDNDSANSDVARDGDIISDLVSTLSGGLTEQAAREGITPVVVNGSIRANWAAFDSLVQDNTDTGRPRAYLNYMLFDSRMHLVSGASGAFQVNGSGDWSVTGTNGIPVKVPENGFIFIFINNHSKKPVWFDKIQVLFHRGKLKEEDHYYPFGLPMANIGSAAAGAMPNRRKYQSNEFITDAGLNWMSFGARQYDPQIGRFLSIDPLAAAGGQDRFSPYAAMGDEPAGNVDPNGMAAGRVANPNDLKTTGPGWVAPYDWRNAYIEAHWDDAGWGDDAWDAISYGFGAGGGSGSAGQANLEQDILNGVFDDISGIGNGMGASSGYVSNIGSPGGDGDAEDACYSMTAVGGKPGSKENPVEIDGVTVEGEAYYAPLRQYLYTATHARSLFENIATTTDGFTIFLTETRAGQMFGQFGRPSLGEARLASEALGRISKTIGGSALLLGTVVDGIQMYRYQNGYRDEYAISPTKAGSNVIVGAIGYFGGVPGAIFAGIYTITDGFYIDEPIYPIYNNQFPTNDNMYVAPPAGALSPFDFSNSHPDVIGPPIQ